MSTSTASAPPGHTGLLRRHRANAVIAGGLLAGVLVVVALGGSASTEPLDPDNPGRDGGQALARVLADEGVDVSVVRSADGLDATPTDAATTVLVTSTHHLGPSTLQRLRDRTDRALLVLALPGELVTDGLGYQPGSRATGDEPRAADCVDAALAARLDDLTVEVQRGTEYPAPAGCWFGDGGALLAQPEEGVVLLGAPDLIRNASIVRADHAAAALRLLGQRDRLVWYVPNLADLTGSDEVSLASLLPAWLRPALWLGALALLAVVLWRGRRLGPLVSEPLPVVVKAIETTRSRGRLYRKANDRAHAAAALRSAALAAAAERLRLPGTSDPSMLVREVARHLGRSPDEVALLLDPRAPAPATDSDLVELARALARLDREVHLT